ncbi:right-handed parallel beta-helix repeat-containing protein [Pseudopedobacter beijingensis]|uniref:Right-handed parallel beta-helix repeat-containing protein n=1 Tax=Pseudopedobacter beijingensis TaxID=1207056 RepID=A0ABW4IAJ4_9SPHI
MKLKLLKKTASAVALFVFAGMLTSCNKTEIASDKQELTGASKKDEQSSILSTIYYVATTGNDSNTGTSLATPFKTIQKALNTAAAGSTIYVRGGTYYERLNWVNSGTVGAHITLSNYSGEVVNLDGSLPSVQDAMILISNKSYLTVVGLNIRNNYRAYAKGIHILGSGTSLAIGSCKIYNIGWHTSKTAYPSPTDQANPFVIVGSGASSYNNIYIGGLEIYDCVTGYSECLTLNGNVDNFTIENNNIHDNTNIGIDVAGHYSWTGAPAAVNQVRNGVIRNNTVTNCVSQVAVSAGIYSDGAANVIIERNKLSRNGCGISLGCENTSKTSSNITVRNNFVYNNIKAGIVVGANASGSKVDYSSVNNNTFFKNCSDGLYGGEIHYQHADHITQKNNIIQSRSNVVIIALSGYSATNLTMDYNMYYTLSGSSGTITFDGIGGTGYYSLATFKSGTGKDINSNYYNPLFVNNSLPNPDLHLSSTSPAINSGDPSFVIGAGELDIDGGTRLLNGRVEKGADEITSTRPPTL